MKKFICILFLLSACSVSYPLGMSQAQWNSLSPAQQQQAIASQQQQDALLRQQQEDYLRQQQEQQLYAERERLEAGARQRLGITQAEWEYLSPDKKLDLRQQQEQIEREVRTIQERSSGNNEVALATREIAGAINASSRRELYTNSAYGSVVDCEISGGNAKFSSGLWNSKWSPLAPVRFSVAKGDAVNVPIRRLDKQRQSSAFWVAFREGQELEFCAAQDTDQRYKRCRTHPVTAAYQQNYTAPLSIPSVIDGATLNCRFAPGRI